MTFCDNRIYRGNIFSDAFNHCDFEIGMVVLTRVSVFYPGRLTPDYVSYKSLVQGIASGEYTLIRDVR